ncbi:hypothetical protein EGR_07742 [Echinococcus granulosus]|uniref:Uncharacterized protein n=1 Tax=Echinococcus granulosus TaxID=6210 RepID=W6U856_ECHGR|nr:hypothetical protein EGR_07742 [Echinococcus granulosus]EUB57418.1 hypothetical protein EGR_07742 [Echinococcus granulosus]
MQVKIELGLVMRVSVNTIDKETQPIGFHPSSPELPSPSDVTMKANFPPLHILQCTALTLRDTSSSRHRHMKAVPLVNRRANFRTPACLLSLHHSSSAILIRIVRRHVQPWESFYNDRQHNEQQCSTCVEPKATA